MQLTFIWSGKELPKYSFFVSTNSGYFYHMSTVNVLTFHTLLILDPYSRHHQFSQCEILREKILNITDFVP